MANLFNYAIEWSFGLKALLLYVVAFVFVIAIMVLILELASKKEEYISTKDKIRRTLKYNKKPSKYLPIDMENEEETSLQVEKIAAPEEKIVRVFAYRKTESKYLPVTDLHLNDKDEEKPDAPEEKIVRVFAYRKGESKYLPITNIPKRNVIEEKNDVNESTVIKETVKSVEEKVEVGPSIVLSLQKKQQENIVLSLPKKQQEEIVLSLPKKEKEEIVLSLQKKTNEEVTLSLPKKKKTNNKDIITTIVILLCVFVLSAITPSIAKYFTEQSTDPNAHLAEFIEIDKDEYVSAIDLNDIVIDPSSDVVNRKFKVHNNGETAIKCKFVVTTTGNLPLIYSWSIQNQSEITTSLEFEQIMGIDEQLIYNLSIVWDITNKSYAYSTEIDFVSITLYCEQYSGGE